MLEWFNGTTYWEWWRCCIIGKFVRFVVQFGIGGENTRRWIFNLDHYYLGTVLVYHIILLFANNGSPYERVCLWKYCQRTYSCRWTLIWALLLSDLKWKNTGGITGTRDLLTNVSGPQCPIYLWNLISGPHYNCHEQVRFLPPGAWFAPSA